MIEKIKEIMDNVECRFCMQTNGKLLHVLPTEYLLRLDKLLVSIDGTREITDANRGKGTYDCVIKNIREARQRGFAGEIVARMVATSPQIDVHVKHVLSLGLFDSVHWQLDAGFYKHDFNEKNFTKFVSEYNKRVSALMHHWVETMNKGTVLPIYPFLGICDSLLNKTTTKLRCGSGHANFTITTDAKLSACPIMNSVKTFYCGSLEEGIIRNMGCGEPCTSCEYLGLCGGRCLYANRAKLWPREGEELICTTIKHLIDECKRILPTIRQLIQDGTVKREDFLYEKYFGPEIIP